MIRTQQVLSFILVAFTLSAYTPALAQRSGELQARGQRTELRGKRADKPAAQRGQQRAQQRATAPNQKSTRKAQAQRAGKQVGKNTDKLNRELAERSAFAERRQLARKRVLKRLEAKGVSRAELRRIEELLELRSDKKRPGGAKPRGKAQKSRGKYPVAPKAKAKASGRQGKPGAQAGRGAGGASKRAGRGGRGGQRGRGRGRG